MKIKIEIDITELKKLIKNQIEETIDHVVDLKDIVIEVKSKQNFKSEWEVADFRAIYNYNKTS